MFEFILHVMEYAFFVPRLLNKKHCAHTLYVIIEVRHISNRILY